MKIRLILAGLALMASILSVISCGSKSPAGPSPTPTPTVIPTPPPYKTSVGLIYDPQGIAFSPSGNSSYVIFPNGANSSFVFYTNWSAVTTLTSFGGTSWVNNELSDAVNPSTGDVYLLDQSGKKVYEYTSAGATVGFLSAYGSTNFLSPVDISTAPNGRLYVADTGLSKVFEFNSAGATVTSFDVVNPISISVSPVSPYNVYVASGTSTNLITEYSSAGVSMASWGGTAPVSGVGQGQFEAIDRIAVAANGDVYVSDGESGGQADDFVQQFSASGTFLTQWGGTGTANGQFHYPEAIAFNGGDVYVCDSWNNRVEVFGP
ncbi:MAG TPA: NHL repeat-containing protein [bacterium]|nr:NHL repeat-containing protein [bacterium]